MVEIFANLGKYISCSWMEQWNLIYGKCFPLNCCCFWYTFRVLTTITRKGHILSNNTPE